MSVSAESRRQPTKKDIEERYVVEARASSTVFPRGALVRDEEPDFRLLTDSGIIGLEVTELCRAAPRAERGRLRKVVERAEARCAGLGGTALLEVGAAFSQQAASVKTSVLADALAAFVHARGAARGNFSDDLPDGYTHVAIFDARGSAARWRDYQGFATVAAPKALLDERIAEKNLRVETYRKKTGVVWLLIVNDQFLGAGEVQVRLEDARAWRFAFGFDKVLIYLRQPGGHGEVIELQRS